MLSAAPSRSVRDAASVPPYVPRAGAAAVGRCLRLPMFTVVSTLLAVTAHGVAQRMTPDASRTGIAVAVVGAVGVVLCRRRRSFETIVAGLVVAQVLAHVVLCLDLIGLTVQPLSAHAHAGTAGGAVQGLLPQLAPDPAMALAHLLAAGVAGWWLSQGEAAVWSAASRWWAVVVRTVPTAGPVCGPVPRIAGAGRVAALHDQVAGRRSRPRRGPPSVAAVA